MPSGKEMYLWWSEEAESMFVYYLTGAIAIALIATLAIARSLRRKEHIVTELLHEDNTREMLVTYMLKIVTSIIPGCGCPESAKVFMKLTGEKKMSQYFQLRSNTGGKAMLQRGFTDIFLFKVPDSLGEIKSVELLVAGLDGPFKWKLEEVQLYSPSKRERRHLPVTVTLLEVLDFDATKNIWLVTSFCGRWTRIQMLFHQWIAGYGNTVRLGAFTEVVHAMNIFMSLFTLLILSQICYIILPRGDHIVPTEKPTKTLLDENSEEDDDDDAGPFDIKISSLFIAAVVTSTGCSFLTLCIEILIRSVRSNEKDPGKAYHSLCDKDTYETFEKKRIVTSEVDLKGYFVRPLFLSPSTRKEDKLEDMGHKHHTSEVAFYLKQLIHFLQTGHDKYMKKVEATRKKMPQEAVRVNLQMRRNQEKKKRHLKETDVDDAFKGNTGLQGNSSQQEREDVLEETEIDFPTLSDISLSQFLTPETSLNTKPGETYLDILKKKRLLNTSKKYFRERRSSWQFEIPLEQFEIPRESNLKHLFFNEDDEYTETQESQTIGATGRPNKSYISGWLDGSQNAVIEEFDNIAATGGSGKSDECFVDIPESDHSNPDLQSTAAEEDRLSDEKFCRIHDWIDSSERSKASEIGFVEAWQVNQKAWCRRVIKKLCDVIRNTREMLISDELSFFQMHSDLLDISCSIVQLLMVACCVHCNEEQYKTLMSKQILCLMWHMSMEILVNVLREIFHVLQLRDSAVLADLVLQSHHVMLVVRHAVYPIMYMVHYGAGNLCLLRHIPLEKDLHCMIVELAKCCFELVVKFNLVLWQKLKILVNREFKEYLDAKCYIQLMKFVQGNIQDHSTERTMVKRLCSFVEDSSREEAWDDLHIEKQFYSNILVQIHVIKSLKRKISNLTKKKYKFDKANDLLPKEPKSRLQLLVEKRRKKPEFAPEFKYSKSKGKHVLWSIKTKKAEIGIEEKKELEKRSKELGHYVENLTLIHQRLKKMIERRGITQSVNGTTLLAQAVLHPHVIVTLGVVKVEGMYQFKNYLHLKRMENILAQFYEVAVKHLVGYLLNTVLKEYDLKSAQLVQFDTLIHDVSVKIDTMAEVLSEGVEAMMHRCIKMEPYLDRTAKRKRNVQVELMVKPSVNGVLQTPSIKKWSGLDLADCMPSEMSELGKMMEAEGMALTELTDFYKKNSCADESDFNSGLLDTYHIHQENDTQTWSLADIIDDFEPLKEYLGYLRHGESLRNVVTQMGYIERAKRKREYFTSVQVNNIIDSYYMLDEGDDSQTLTKAGLYQLEHDCIGEDLKPLPSLVKTVTLTIMTVLLVLIVVYITVIGGQFSTTELQEWMCYFLLAVAIFGLFLEQLRAYIVALYVRRWKQKVEANINGLREVDII